MAIRVLRITAETGGDDLRSGSRASIALLGRDSSDRPVDLFVAHLNAPGERFADRSSKTVMATVPLPIEVEDVEFVELRFEADRGFASDQWHCARISVLANPDASGEVWLWDQAFSRDDQLNIPRPTRRSLRLPRSRYGYPQIEFELTTGGDDLRSDSGGWIELELADGRTLSRVYLGEFKPGSIHRLVFDLEDPLVDGSYLRGVAVRRARLFYGRALIGPIVSGIPGEIWLMLTTNDNWDLERLRVRSSHNPSAVSVSPAAAVVRPSFLPDVPIDVPNLPTASRPVEYVLVNEGPLRLSRYFFWESPVLAPRALLVPPAGRFLIELFTGGDDLRVGAGSDIFVELVLRSGEIVPLTTRARPDQPFVAPPGGGGVWAGSFANWAIARSVGVTAGARALAVADVTAVRVSSRVETGDHWTLNGVRLSAPADGGGALEPFLRSHWRMFASFLNLGVTLHSGRPWQSPAIS